jgi:general secretion pathway protein K
MMRRKQRGATFVITVAVIGALTAIVASVAAMVNLNADVRINREEGKRARMAANSGIQYALSALYGQSATSAVQTDAWATLGCSAFTSPADVVNQVSDGYFRVQIVDACSLININTAPVTQLENLPLTQEQVDSLSDWRSAGDTALPDGAKDDFYNSLPNPYNAKLGPLDSVDELLQIQYFTRDVIYDTPTITAVSQVATGSNGLQPPIASMITVDATSPLPTVTGGINVRTAGGNTTQLAQQLTAAGLPVNLVTQIVQGRPFTTYGRLLSLPGVTAAQATIMLNRLTVNNGTTATNRININTASQQVLQTLPGMESDTASAIVTQQATGITSLGNLMTVPGVTVANAAQFIDSITVGSQTFLIRVIGWVGNTTVSLEATVSVTNGTPKILKILDQAFPNMDVRWNWADAATTNTLVDPSTVQTQ